MSDHAKPDTPETDAHELYCVKLGARECSLWSPLARRLEKERDQLRARVADLLTGKADHELIESLRAQLAALQQGLIDEREDLRKEYEARLSRQSEKIAAQAARIRYLEGATNHATGTPLSRANEVLKVARKALNEARTELFRHCNERTHPLIEVDRALTRIEELTKETT